MLEIDKKITMVILILVILVFAGIIGWTFFQKGKLPSEQGTVLEEETTEQILERLTPTEANPLTQEEQGKLDALLEQLTPTEPKPLAEQENKETEELLKQLTPQ
ncbi:hypothetical protein KKH07_02870 [Patescibacteria group bacterium]|nr:hypothetical protein [Patescibacteria group bacterium]MBU1563953.1 hypothetical protein [Patescibacteria group bacterium]